MTLHLGEEVGNVLRSGEYKGFTHESSEFGAADVESVAQTGQIGQVDVALGRGEGVTEAGAVDEEPNTCLVADVAEGGEFFKTIECAYFGGLGNIEGTGPDGVVAVLVILITLEPFAEDMGHHLPFDGPERKDFMSGRLHGPGLKGVDVAGLCCQDALVGPNEGIDGGDVGGCAANEEVDSCFGTATGLAYFFTRCLA